MFSMILDLAFKKEFQFEKNRKSCLELLVEDEKYCFCTILRYTNIYIYIYAWKNTNTNTKD